MAKVLKVKHTKAQCLSQHQLIRGSIEYKVPCKRYARHSLVVVAGSYDVAMHAVLLMLGSKPRVQLDTSHSNRYDVANATLHSEYEQYESKYVHVGRRATRFTHIG